MLHTFSGTYPQHSSKVHKTGFWISQPYLLEIADYRVAVDDPTAEKNSCDPIGFRFFPETVDNTDILNTFQNPVILQGDPYHVYEAVDLIKWIHNHKTNPCTGETVTIHNINPVRFPGFRNYQKTIELLRKKGWDKLPEEDASDAPPVGNEIGMPFVTRPIAIPGVDDDAGIDVDFDNSSDPKDEQLQRATKRRRVTQRDMIELNSILDVYLDRYSGTPNTLVNEEEMFPQLIKIAEERGLANILGSEPLRQNQILQMLIRNRQAKPQSDHRNIISLRALRDGTRQYLVNAIPLDTLMRNYISHLPAGSMPLATFRQRFIAYCQGRGEWSSRFTLDNIKKAIKNNESADFYQDPRNNNNIVVIKDEELTGYDRAAQDFGRMFDGNPQTFDRLTNLVDAFRDWLVHNNPMQLDLRRPEVLQNALLHNNNINVEMLNNGNVRVSFHPSRAGEATGIRVGFPPLGGGGATSIRLFEQTLLLFVQSPWGTIWKVVTLDRFMEIFLKFCEAIDVHIERDTFTDDQLRDALASNTERTGIQLSSDRDGNTTYTVRNQENTFFQTIQNFVNNHYPPVIYNNMHDLLNSFRAHCMNSGYNLDNIDDDDITKMLEEWPDGITKITVDDDQEMYSVGFDAPPSSPP